MMQTAESHESASRRAVQAIAVIVVVYVMALGAGLPQRATELIVGQNHAPTDSAPAEHAAADPHPTDIVPPDHGTREQDDPAHSHDLAKAIADDHSDHGDHAEPEPPPAYTVIPFVLLLGAIAVFPLLPFTHHWWESNLHRFLVAAGLSLVVVLYYLFIHDQPIVGHFPAHHISEMEADEIVHVETTIDLVANALLTEYIPFMTLLFSLYAIAGGVRIEGDLAARPIVNTAFIGIGGLLASFIGTTGAAMLLIRPLLETNRERRHVSHTVVIFIFVVCNCGGCLLPIGDPPLFLGYLAGVPFLWTLTLWLPWLFVNVSLLAIYWLWDRLYYYPKETPRDIALDEQRTHPLRFGGVKLNGLLLVGVILAVALLDPSKKVPGTDWHPWLYLREVVQLTLVGISLLFGAASIRRLNHFNYGAIIEVAALFFGIFICMQPALQILNANGASLGLGSPTKFFWATGGLSSFLDNAPTYLVFFETANAMTREGGPGILQLTSGHFMREDLLVGISLGAVFMGAMTYIGNGPNFMVKAIAEASGVRMPSFFGYMLYSCVILLPLLVVMNVLFL